MNNSYDPSSSAFKHSAGAYDPQRNVFAVPHDFMPPELRKFVCEGGNPLSAWMGHVFGNTADDKMPAVNDIEELSANEVISLCREMGIHPGHLSPFPTGDILYCLPPAILAANCVIAHHPDFSAFDKAIACRAVMVERGRLGNFFDIEMTDDMEPHEINVLTLSRLLAQKHQLSVTASEVASSTTPMSLADVYNMVAEGVIDRTLVVAQKKLPEWKAATHVLHGQVQESLRRVLEIAQNSPFFVNFWESMRNYLDDEVGVVRPKGYIYRGSAEYNDLQQTFADMAQESLGIYQDAALCKKSGRKAMVDFVFAPEIDSLLAAVQDFTSVRYKFFASLGYEAAKEQKIAHLQMWQAAMQDGAKFIGRLFANRDVMNTYDDRDVSDGVFPLYAALPCPVDVDPPKFNIFWDLD